MNIKYILLCLLIFIVIPSAYAVPPTDTYFSSTTNIEFGARMIGGSDLITPKPHYNDTYFIISNEGTNDFIIYMYNYTGTKIVENQTYLDSVIAYIKPGEYTIVPQKAQYNLYGSYDELRDITDVEVVKKKFNQWWLILVVIGFLLIAVVKIYKVIVR